jgi:hypothetical protein
MRRLGILVLAAGLLAGCAGSTSFSGGVIDEWLSVCMEGPPYETFCRCYADAVAPFTSEEEFVSNYREPLAYLSTEAVDAAQQACGAFEPILRSTGIAGVPFGAATDEALDDLEEIFGDAAVTSPSECPAATVATWAGLRAIFTGGAFSGWAYGAAEPGGEFESLGLHAEISTGDTTTFLYWYDSLDTTERYVGGTRVVDEHGSTTLIVTDSAGVEMRAVAVAEDAVRLEAGAKCTAG